MSIDTAGIPFDSRPILFTEVEQFGGAERAMLSLAQWLYERGLSVHVVTYSDRCGLDRHATHPLKVLQLRPEGGPRSGIAAIRKYFKERPQGPQPIVSGYQPALHATLAGLRGFHTMMLDTPSLFGDQDRRPWHGHLRIAVSNRIIGHGMRSGGTVIVNSEYLKSESRRDFGVEARIVRMGGLTPSEDGMALAKRRGAAGELRLFSVCRIEANKRIDWMLKALAALESGTPALSSRANWRLDLAGKGSLIPELKQFAASLGIADRVYFHGFVSDADLEQMYREADLFLMPAVQGYGLPALESLQRGLPVLLHRESGVSDILMETPWATVFSGGPENLVPALGAAIDGVLSGAQVGVPLPPIPTESQWAEEVARLSGWL